PHSRHSYSNCISTSFTQDLDCGRGGSLPTNLVTTRILNSSPPLGSRSRKGSSSHRAIRLIASSSVLISSLSGRRSVTLCVSCRDFAGWSHDLGKVHSLRPPGVLVSAALISSPGRRSHAVRVSVQRGSFSGSFVRSASARGSCGHKSSNDASSLGRFSLIAPVSRWPFCSTHN